MEIQCLHGDMVLLKSPIPDGTTLKPATDLIIAGSHTSPHTIAGKVLTSEPSEFRERWIRISEDTTISHAGRHATKPLPAGDYRVYPQRERGSGMDRAVED